ncbi:MAG: SEL1-like repeat protein [Enterocloster asparagiformis]|nr:SEL1-like repeat protein [Enterocloster asparagiformis]
MQSILMSKFRCAPPNKKGTASHNRNAVIYIATREGTDLSLFPEEKYELEMSDNHAYAQYIAERPRSHGLFGNLESIHDLEKTSKTIYQLSKNTPIFRGIISLREDDALELGYSTKEAWKTFVEQNIYDIASELRLPTNQHLQWCAAYHQEPGHPHVHLMLWRNDHKIQSPYIHPSTQNRIRTILSGKITAAQREQEVLQKNQLRAVMTELGKKITEEEVTALTKNIYDTAQSGLCGKISNAQLTEIANTLQSLVNMLPAHGRLNYKLMPPETKAQINRVIAAILKKPEIQSVYNAYIDTTVSIARTYSPTPEQLAITTDKASRDIQTRLGNIILKTLKSNLIKKQQTFYKTIENNHRQFEHTITRKAITFPNDSDNFIEAPHPFPIDQTSENKILQNISQVSLLELPTPENHSENFSNESILPDDTDSHSATKNVFSLNAGVDLLHKEISPPSSVGASSYALRKFNADKSSGVYDPKQAIDYFKTSAQAGNPMANYALGKIFSDPESMYFDLTTALQHLEIASASEQTAPYALFLLGKLYSDKDTPLYAIDQAISYFKASVQAGNYMADYELGKIYADEQTKYFDIDKALSLLTPIADAGYDSAQFKIGHMYLWGKNVKQDVELGYYWLEKASQQGNKFAQDSLDSYKYYHSLEYRISYMLIQTFADFLANQNHNANVGTEYEHLHTDSVKALREKLRKKGIHLHKEKTHEKY